MSDHKYKEGDRVKLNPNMEWSNIGFYNSKTFSILYEKTFKILNVRTDEPKGDNGKVFLKAYTMELWDVLPMPYTTWKFWAPEKFIKNKVEE